MPAKALELTPHGGMVAREQLRPGVIAELADAFRRADDVGEEDRRQHPVCLRRRPGAGDELLDLIDDRILILGPPGVIGAGKLDQPRARDVGRDVASLLDV